MDEAHRWYVRTSNINLGNVTIPASTGTSGTVTITRTAICNEMLNVFITRFGNMGSYATQLHIYAWSWSNGVLSITLVGDVDTYTNVVIGMLWK